MLYSNPSSPSSPGSSCMSSDGEQASWGYISSYGGHQGHGGGDADGRTRLWTRRLKERPLMSILTYGEAGPAQHLGNVLVVQP